LCSTSGQIEQNSVIVPLAKIDARQILSQIDFSPRCRQIADYWLSIWDGDLLPGRSCINPASIKPLLPGVIIFEVVPGMSVTVGLSGTDFQSALKCELTAADWLNRTPLKGRAKRLRIFSQIARGAIGFNRWCFTHDVQGVGVAICEKLLLPLRPDGDDAAICVLGFVDWSDARQKFGCRINLEYIAPPELIGREFLTDGGLMC
jgi:hypothetical protein